MSIQWQMLWARVISSVTCGIFIVKQLGKHDFSYDFLLPNKCERQEMFFWSDE